MKQTLTHILTTGAIGLASLSGISQAAVLIDGTTLNGSFESSDLSIAGDAKNGFDMVGKDITNWQNTDTTYAGVFDNSYDDTGVDYNAGGAHSGNQFAFVHGGDSGTFNLTSYIISPGDLFTLTWWGRADTIAVRLFSSSDGTYGTASTLNELVQVQDNAYTQYSFNYAAVPADYGKTIGVSIFHPLAGGWSNADDVMLTVVPEPSSSMSLIFGGAALVLRRSRKRSSAA
ncbi:MAG: PEP-CTERM sorting domain-containing protein [Verrucomicrobiota bacterium]